MKRIVLFAIAVIAAADLHAQCSLNLQKRDLGRGKSWELTWNTVSGIADYTLEVIRKDEEAGTTTTHSIDVDARGSQATKTVAITTTVPLTVTYRVTAIGTPQPCSATINVTYPSDTPFQRVTRKSVIPLVGSTRGAGGALFKTSLRLRGTKSNQRGLLIFHPANAPAQITDPSIEYRLAGTASTQAWDDIVAAFGVNGVGTIDIVPEFTEQSRWSVPAAEIRLYNVTSVGTYGATEAQTQAYDYLAENPDALKEVTVTVPGPDLRLNLAIRSFELPTTAEAEVLRDGDRVAINAIDIPKETLLFNAAHFFTGFELRAGDVVTIRITGGGGIPLYTLTDNSTNDPALYAPPTRIRYQLEEFDIGF
jgi:hypothetical protein